jgi:O-antigen ligase
MTVDNCRSLSRIEFVLLCLFAIALPLVEAPKNIFWALFVVVWLAGSFRSGNFGQLTRGWDLLFASLIIAPLLSVVLSPYSPQWKEIGDIVGYISLGWILARSRLETGQVKGLLTCLIAATLSGVVQGYWIMQTDPKRVWLQLNSVGHVNHSALYGAGIGVLANALAACGVQRLGHGIWRLALASAVLMFGAMIVFASRGALVAYLAGSLPVLLVLPHLRLRRLLPGLGLCALIGIAIGLAGNTLIHNAENHSIIEKTAIGIESGNLSSFRLQALNTAIELMRQHPLTGAGAAKFNAASPELVEQWVKARGETFIRERYFFSSHAHGLYANTLGERGVLGLGVLLILMASWTLALLRRWPRAEHDTQAQLSWAAGVAGWSIVFVGGLFNTTLHHEHGMLAMLGLGLLLSGASLRNKAAA